MSILGFIDFLLNLVKYIASLQTNKTKRNINYILGLEELVEVAEKSKLISCARLYDREQFSSSECSCR